MRLVYSAIFYLALPFILLRMLWRSRLTPAYRHRLSERFGFVNSAALGTGAPVIWVHAVSVGETIAAAPVVETLLARYPNHRLVVTTTTPTGSDRVKALFGERVFHCYAPWDLPGATSRFIAAVRPELLVIMETELWPNLLHHCARSGCPVVLANARLSERSARGYARIASLTRPMLQHLHTVGCQSAPDGERFITLGLPADRLQVTGSIKFDLGLSQGLIDEARALDAELNGDQRTVGVAASTHPGEDEQLLEAFQHLKATVDSALLVLVPRHPERFKAVYEMAVRAGWQVRRRSVGGLVELADDVLIGDTMCELLILLGAADIAVMGGSLVEHGGHNVLEPAVWGVPVITGPHMFNFEEISQLLMAAGAMEMMDDPAKLTETLVSLALDPQRRATMGDAGRRVVDQNRGAKERLVGVLAAVYPPPEDAA